MIFSVYLLMLGGVVSAGLVSVFVSMVVRRRSKELDSLSLRTLRISLPRDEEDEKGKDVVLEISRTEQLLASLAALSKPFVLELAVHEKGEHIFVYLSVAQSNLEFAARQVQGYFPDAEVSEVEEYSIFFHGSSVAGSVMSLSQSFVLPLRTYVETKIDSFAPLVSTFSQLREQCEGAALQIVLTPAPKSAKKTITAGIKQLQKGESLSKVLKVSVIRELKKVFGKKKEETEEKKIIVDEEAVKALTMKVSKPLFRANVRAIASAQSQDRAEDIVLSITNSFSQFAAPVRNAVTWKRIKDISLFAKKFAFRDFENKNGVILNVEEVASMFHVPTLSTDVPRMQWLRAKQVAPPLNLPGAGLVLGETAFRGEHKPVRLQDDDRRRHLYLVGQTGTGKSYLQLSMAVQDIQNGKGVCVIDPHGDLIDDILARVPRERVDDVIVFNPGDIERPLGLNMLEFNPDHPEEKTFIVNEMIGIFNRLYDLKTSGGPMFEQFMRNTLLLLMEDAVNEPATLMDVARVFTDDAYRKRKLARIKNTTVIDFWEKEAVKTTGDQGLANMTPYVTSKFTQFTANDYIRPIIGQPKSAFNMREVMDEGKILLVSLAKGKIGDLNAQLLGMIITGRILMAALSRTDMPMETRRDFYFYIDEFQNFTTDSISTILSEARKYRLNMILAHQFIGQLTDEIRDAVFGNVGSLAAFRVGNPDEETLVKIFGPEFSERDLISIENRNVIAKLLIEGQPSRPFNFKTVSAGEGSRVVGEKLKELSRLVHGRDRAEIEEEIYSRMRG